MQNEKLSIKHTHTQKHFTHITWFKTFEEKKMKNNIPVENCLVLLFTTTKISE